MATSGTRSRPCRARLRRSASATSAAKKLRDHFSAMAAREIATSGARTVALGLVLSTTTDRPAASDSARSCSCLRCGWRLCRSRSLADMVVRAGKPLAEESRLAGCRQAYENQRIP